MHVINMEYLSKPALFVLLHVAIATSTIVIEAAESQTTKLNSSTKETVTASTTNPTSSGTDVPTEHHSHALSGGVNSLDTNPGEQMEEDVSILKKTIFDLGTRKESSSTADQGNVEYLYQKYSSQEDCTRPRHCADVKCCGAWRSGVYKVYLYGVGTGRYVYCDLDEGEAGWTVIQRRQDGSEDFNRNWIDYENGFGQLNGEFWLGLSTIHDLLSQNPNELLITMRNFTGGSTWAKYDWIYVSGPTVNYRLQVGRYAGTAGDYLTYHNGRMFSTRDRDNDDSGVHCAESRDGAWWFRSCYYVHFNGLYCGDIENQNKSCVAWHQWGQQLTPVQFVEMKVKPVTSRPGCIHNQLK